MPPTETSRPQTASEVIEWSVGTFGSSLCLTSSMTDTVLIDLSTAVDPDIEVVFLDTGFHFAATLGTLRDAIVRYSLAVHVVRPEDGAGRPDDVWTNGADACCAARKAAPLDRALEGRAAWLSGLRRVDSPERASAPIVELDRRGLFKINPIANWSDADVETYVERRGLIVNPLIAQGYPSIGCWPCTRPAFDGDSRAGRWAGTVKTECGLHL